MITIETVLMAEKEADIVWNLFNNVNSIAGLVPTCKSYELVDEDTVHCELRLRLGLIPLDSKALVKITERRNNRYLEAMGETEAGEMTKKLGKVATGTKTKLHLILQFEEVNGGKTRIHITVNADAVGQMKRIYEAIIAGQRTKLEAQFVQRVEKALGCKVALEERPVPEVVSV